MNQETEFNIGDEVRVRFCGVITRPKCTITDKQISKVAHSKFRYRVDNKPRGHYSESSIIPNKILMRSIIKHNSK